MCKVDYVGFSGDGDTNVAGFQKLFPTSPMQLVFTDTILQCPVIVQSRFGDMAMRIEQGLQEHVAICRRCIKDLKVGESGASLCQINGVIIDEQAVFRSQLHV